MLASQRDLFDMPRDICYLNSASCSPLPLRTQEAGRAAVGRKGTPWTLDAAFANGQHERARTAAAAPDRRRAGRRRADLLGQLRRRDRRQDPDDRRAAPASSCWKTTIPRRCWNGRPAPKRGGFTVDTVRQPRPTATGPRRCSTRSSARARRRSRSPRSPPCIGRMAGARHRAVGAALKQQGARFLIDATHDVGVRRSMSSCSIPTF